MKEIQATNEDTGGQDARAPVPRGWHNRGYLPHYDGGEINQFITVHLGDALPKKVLDRWKSELQNETDENRKKELYWRTEKYIDQGYGKCYLRLESVAVIIRDALK